jgi:fluoride exporter
MSAGAWIGAALLGGCGAVLRFGLDSLIERRASTDFPLGTFTINLSGAFALGALSAAGIGTTSLFVVGVGLLGSYTTFSTWIFESEQLAADGEYLLAAANLLLGTAAGFGFALAGWKIGAAL